MSRSCRRPSSTEPPHDLRVPQPANKRKFDELDISQQGRMCFLVKVPKPVMQAWCDPSHQSGDILGQVVITKQEGHATHKTEITLSEESCPGVPQVYDLEFATESANMRVFSIQGENASALEGYVEQSGFMRPKHGIEYRRQLRGRARDQFINAKHTVEYEDIDGIDSAFAAGETAEDVAARRDRATFSTVLDSRAVSLKEIRKLRRVEKKRQNKQKQQTGLCEAGRENLSGHCSISDAIRLAGKVAKKPRLNEEDLRMAIFKHFKTKSHWSIRDMNQNLGQPATWLKKCLIQVAWYCRKGEHKGTYQLKDEYQTGIQAQA